MFLYLNHFFSNIINKMNEPKDIKLYNKIKNKIYKKYPIHSAYRSGILVQEYKKEYLKKYNNQDAYYGKKNTSGLKRWFKEEWKNDKGNIGYQYKNSVYRPTKRITKNTPTTFNELTKEEIKKAKEKKYRKGRVNKFKLS